MNSNWGDDMSGLQRDWEDDDDDFGDNDEPEDDDKIDRGS